MARKTQSRLELRKQAEAAEAMDAEIDIEVDDAGDEDAPKKKKKAVKKKTATRAKRLKTKAVVRKRLVWGVFSSSMKEEARFPYAEREAAEQRAEALTQKNKRTYFVQPIKEPIPDAPPAAAAE